jgi:protein tyrosine/serine phosphatase
MIDGQLEQLESTGTIQWVIQGVLARSSRPSYLVDATPEAVSQWLDQALQLGIKTIISLLSDSELQKYYGSHGIALLKVYRWRGLEVIQLPAEDHQDPALNPKQISALRRIFAQVRKPVLVHSSAGIDRTGMAIEHLQNSFLDHLHH